MSRTDSIYQQLRSHLAYLKLAAAAEALPEALERARTTKTGHTEFVEQLLAIEVAATEQRRWDARMRFANFPAPWTIADFDFTAQPSVDEAMIRELGTCSFLDDARRRQDHARYRVGSRRSRRRTPRLLHDRSRPRREVPQSSPRREVGRHDAVLLRTRRPHHRRTPG